MTLGSAGIHSTRAQRLKLVVNQARFLTITDPLSKLETEARSEGIPAANIFHGVKIVGGRFSAVSNFGMVPATVLGINVARFLRRANAMAAACSDAVPAAANPGVVLGAILGAAHNQGRNKLTLIASPGIHDLGAWLEQLVAESTGKQGKAIIPVDHERIVAPEVYGEARLFVYLRLATKPDAAQDKAVARLEHAGLPVVRISVRGAYGLAEEFFGCEIATAVAGAILSINPFNQPDVEASKIATRELMEKYKRTGNGEPETSFFEEGDFKLFADDANSAALRAAAGEVPTFAGLLKAHLDQLGKGDYFAMLAHLDMNAENEGMLQAMSHAVRAVKRVATCLGFEPRFLHSTGQAYKGGPNAGVFLQITSDHSADLNVPGEKFTFGIVVDAQSRGDLQVLAERKRRALRVHLGADVRAGLTQLAAAVEQASV